MGKSDDTYVRCLLLHNTTETVRSVLAKNLTILLLFDIRPAKFACKFACYLASYLYLRNMQHTNRILAYVLPSYEGTTVRTKVIFIYAIKMIIIHEYHMMTDDDNIDNNKSPKDEWLVSASEVGEREISFVLWVVGIAGSWRFRRTRT